METTRKNSLKQARLGAIIDLHTWQTLIEYIYTKIYRGNNRITSTRLCQLNAH